MLAVFYAVEHFEWLLFGRQFTLQVDHKPLIFMFQNVSKLARRRRQIQYLSTFDINIQYIPGKDNIVADALSRHNIIDTINLNNTFHNLNDKQICNLQRESMNEENVNTNNFSDASGILRNHYGQIYVPQQFRQQIVDSTHQISHSNYQSCYQQLHRNYVWPKMRKYIMNIVQHCTSCQSSKITKHVKPPFTKFEKCNQFDYIHIDFVGPLPCCKNKRYLFTVMDRATRWFFAYPTSTCSSQAAADKLMDWIAVHGVPNVILSDRGTHFESSLFRELTSNLGLEKRSTTAYHPQSNGAIERQHRRLKDSLKAKVDDVGNKWVQCLPLILLGLNNSISKDTNQSAAMAVFHRQLSIPGVIFDNKYDLSNLSTPPRSFSNKHEFVPPALHTCTHVWLQKPGIIKSLDRPYKGPYKVISRNFQTTHL